MSGALPSITWFDPPPAPTDTQGFFANPLEEGQPPVLAQRAAAELQTELRAGFVAPGVPTALLETEAGGKMFGVLVVADSTGRLGWLRAFSGQFDGQWSLPGYAPPLFHQEAFANLERAGEPRVKELTRISEAFSRSVGLGIVRADVEGITKRHAAELNDLRLRHLARRAERRQRRALAGTAEHALDQESRGDKAERRRLDAAHAKEKEEASRQLQRLERRLAALDRLRQRTSRELMRRMHDTYVIANAKGETRSLRALFVPGEPPSGAGDCAAPKLLGWAYAHRLRPIALAEFWWGTPPSSGGRYSGAYYPACRHKCGPLLPFMLEGLPLASRATPPGDVGDGLTIVHEDDRLVVLNKPAGLLSVPGKDESADSILARLRARYPKATGPLLVHRLDLDTSGLLLAALDGETHAALQAQFAGREVSKRYVAWLEGDVAGEAGTIDLPIRVDLDDRPRQIVDPIHGKPAMTRWEVLERRGGRTRVALFPLTGRTHQLRVHVAHPRGLGAPIVGDRLYGLSADRLLLHAERLELTHPGTGERAVFESPAPFQNY